MIQADIDGAIRALQHDHFCIEHVADEIQLLIETIIKDEIIHGRDLSQQEQSDIIKRERDRLLSQIAVKPVLSDVLDNTTCYLRKEEE